MVYDLIIRGGTVIDGTGAPGYRADVAVSGERIAPIGDLSADRAERELDAAGLAVAPGFIDSHAHSDTCFVRDPSCASKLYQGITTEITGQCGDSPFPAPADSRDPWQCASFDSLLARFEREGVMAVNQAIMVGHGTLREAIIGSADRPVTGEELERMKALLRRDLEAGAWGLSLGLEYAPGMFADAAELQALGAVVGAYHGVVTCHMRSEGLKIDEAIDELAGIGRASGVHVHISHLKLDNFRVHGRAREVWDRIRAIRAEGIDLTCDMYPFTASCTSLSIRCPGWSREGGPDELVRRLQGERRAEITEAIRSHYFSAERAETCLINDDAGRWPEIVGKTLRFIAEELLHTTDYAEAAAEILVRTDGRAGGIFFVMDENDMLYFLSQDTGIGSDGYALPVDPGRLDYRPHPRSYATMPEFFRLVRENDLCGTEEAVRRVTSKTADMAGIRDRGRLLPGLIADITVFDPAAFAPRATWLDPIRPPVGIRYVTVAGQVALADGVQTEVRAGRFLRKRQTTLL